MTITREEGLALIEAATYYRGYPWETWAKLRREDPIHRIETDDGKVYWAVTRYHDIVDIERNAEVFKNSPMGTIGVERQPGVNMIVFMDPPEHTAHRDLAKAHFMPRNIAWVREYAEQIVTEVFDRAMERNGEVLDLQDDVANQMPTAVVSAFLGAPRETWPAIIEHTTTIINANDPRVSRDRPVNEVTMAASMQLIGLVAPIFEDRKANPRDDFPTVLVNARINGQPMTQIELLSWALILMTAGHETTQSTFGLIAHELMQRPDLHARLKEDRSLLPQAIEEMLRYFSPAIHFVRTPDRDVEMHGKTIRAGEHMIMFYPSANRDPEVFDKPDEINIDRSPNRHLAFGTGPHLCLGMHLARMELRVMLEQFLDRVESIELAGEPERVFGIATGGLKHIPVRMKVCPKA